MLATFLRLSFRKIWNDRSFTFLSITGLSLATVACATIWLFVGYERSFDEFRSRDVYRVAYHGYERDVETGRSAQVVPALAPAIRNEIPEVKHAIRLAHTGPFMADPVMQYGEKKFRESKMYFAEEGFLTMFSYKIIAGAPTNALASPNQVALSQSSAQKYFGNEDPIGNVLTFHRGVAGAREVTVTAVFEDVPPNSHLHTDFIISFSTIGYELDGDWEWGNFYTYVELQPGVPFRLVESKIPDLLKKNLGKYMTELSDAGNRIEFLLQPIQSIHLESKLFGELEVNGNDTVVNFLNILAIFILVIAWINYINFSIARSAENGKEISIRKISGSSRSQLITQLLTDSALINFFAVCISLAIIQAGLPILKVLIGLPAAISFGWDDSLILLGIFVLGTFCSGLYPAFFISRIDPISLLKTKISRSSIGSGLNRALIVFQFTATVVLVIGTITVFAQLNFIRNKELGLNLEQTLIVKGPAVKDSTYQATLSSFGNETKKLAGVSSFAVASSIPGEELQWGRSFSRRDQPETSIGCYIIAIDENFFDLFDAKFIAGSNYPDGSFMWKNAIIINESAAKQFGYQDASLAIGQTILWSENDRPLPKEVIGVISDFNQQSLHNKVEPIVFTLKEYVFAPWAGEFFAFKIQSTDLRASINDIQGLWNKMFHQNPFDYFFLEDYFNAQYKNDEQLGKVFTAFSILAILIASLGLFGLTAYMTAMRTKEIGVRKVLGSSPFQLVKLLSSQYLKLVVIAFIIACPIATYLMNEWLSQFTYRISLNIWIFVCAGLICFVTAMLTVGVKSWQSANLDPAKALKYE